MSESEKIIMAFDAEALAPLALFVAKNDIRYYLNGLYVAPHSTQKGVIVAATNGHSMALWYDKDGVADQPRIYELSPSLIAAAKKKSTCDDIIFKRQVVFMGGRLCVVGTVADNCGAGDQYLSGKEYFIQAGKPVIDGKFPDLARVIPKNGNLKPGIPGAFAAHLGENVMKAAVLMRARFSAVRCFYDAGEGGAAIMSETAPLVFTVDSCPQFMAVVMPCKAGALEASLPHPSFMMLNKNKVE